MFYLDKASSHRCVPLFEVEVCDVRSEEECQHEVVEVEDGGATTTFEGTLRGID